VKRMPTILAQAIEQTEQHLAANGRDGGGGGAHVLELLAQLREEMANDGLISLIHDAGPDTADWNAYIETAVVAEGAKTWLSAPWLLAECYMYRRIVAALRSSPVTAELDPFRQSKEGSFTHAIAAIHELSVLVSGGIPGDAAAQFGALMHLSLWGNKMDLSLHADAMATVEGGDVSGGGGGGGGFPHHTVRPPPCSLACLLTHGCPRRWSTRAPTASPSTEGTFCVMNRLRITQI
jgi:hypothetical protein